MSGEYIRTENCPYGEMSVLRYPVQTNRLNEVIGMLCYTNSDWRRGHYWKCFSLSEKISNNNQWRQLLFVLLYLNAKFVYFRSAVPLNKVNKQHSRLLIT